MTKTTKSLHKTRGAELLSVTARGDNSLRVYNVPGLKDLTVAEFSDMHTGGVNKFVYFPSEYKGPRTW